MIGTWLRKILGRSPSNNSSTVHGDNRPSVDDQQKEAIRVDPTQDHLLREYLDSLNASFCLELFGILHSNDKPNEAQRANARRLISILAQSQVQPDELPRKPSSLPILLSLLRKDSINNAKISEVLIKDASLTSLVLKTANSPFFKVSDAKVESLDHAIFMMGLSGIRKVVSAAILMPMINRNNDSCAFSDRVWEWALSCGYCVDELMLKRNEDEGSNYLLGLLPALSLLVLCRAIDQLEQSVASAERLLPIQKLGLFRRLAWKYCIAIRQQWDLPEYYDAYLYELKNVSEPGTRSVLCDAMYVSQFALVAKRGTVGILPTQLAQLTESSLEQNHSLLDGLNYRTEFAHSAS